MVDAVEWYEDRRAGLGERLNSEIMELIAFIRVWPASTPLYGRRRQNIPTIRRKGVKVFPYGIIYFVRDNEVIVVAYAHESRQPEYWRGRLKHL